MRSTRASYSEGAVHENQKGKGPFSGKIKAGIQVLAPKARVIEECRKIYAEGWRVGASFDTIKRALVKVQGCPKYPLMPKNVPWFRVCREDFKDPFDVDKIMEMYGEKRGDDKVPHLYQFPIFFMSDDLDEVFPETFEAWRATELMRWSEVRPDQYGEEIVYCMKRQDAHEMAQRGKKRNWGGRSAEIVEPCHPNTCDLFLSGDCTHNGTLRFFIPGVTGAAPIELTFRSIYSKLQIPEVLEAVRRGRKYISGFHNDKPIFWVTKELQNNSRVDWETGKAGRQDQWIITLDTRGIDIGALVLEQAALERAMNDPAPAGTVQLEDMRQFESLDGEAPDLEPEPEPERKTRAKPEPKQEPEPEPKKVVDGEWEEVPTGNDEPKEDPAPEKEEPKQEPEKTEKQEKPKDEKPPEGPEKKKAAPKKKVAAKRVSPKLRKLRGDVERVRGLLGWSDADLSEYILGNFQGRELEEVYADQAAVQAILDNLTTIAGRAKKEETGGDGPPDDGAPPPKDDDCPF